jgi:polyhydroxybutyrate depolymerase
MARPLPDVGRGDHLLAISWEGSRRRYWVHVPAKSAPGEPLPAVFMLHGTGVSARWTMSETGWSHKADTANFLAVFPEGLPTKADGLPDFYQNPRFWRTGLSKSAAAGGHEGDVGFIAAIIDDLSAAGRLDTNRVYVAGFSNGGAMTFQLGADLADRLAAIAPVACVCPVTQTQGNLAMPTLFLIGTADPLVPLEGGDVSTPWGLMTNRPSVDQTLRQWAGLLGCGSEPRQVSFDPPLTTRIYGPGNDGVEMTAFFIDGLGHHWPGGQGKVSVDLAGSAATTVSANDLIWEYFSKHSRR